MEVDSYENGDFVIQEFRDNSLKIFNKNGEFLRSVGRRGRGPGEFLQIQEIHINNNQELLVFDHIQRKVSIFKDFNHVEDRIIFRNRPDIATLHQKNDGTYIVRGTRGGKLLYYEMTENFDVTNNFFVNASQLYPKENSRLPANVTPIITRKNSILTKNDDLIVAPALYNGEILVYKENENYQTHHKLKIENYGPSFLEYTGNQDALFQSDFIQEEILNIVSTPNSISSFYHLNRSLGLFKMSDGSILHFAQIWDSSEERAKLMAEIIDENGTQVIGTQELRSLGDLAIEDYTVKGTKHNRILLNLLHLDRFNNLYVYLEGKDMEPELHIISVSVDLK